METPSPAPRWHLPALLGVALAVRLVAWSRALMMMNDGPDFLWQAQRFLAGDAASAIDHPYHPGYGAAVALVAWLTRLDVETSAIAISIGSGLLMVVAIWATARWLFPREPRAAALAGGVTALFPRAVLYTSDIQSDGLFMALVTVAMWMLYAGIRLGGCRRRLLVAGLCTGLAYLTRPEGLFLGAALAAWLVAPRARAPFPRRVTGVLAFAGGVLLGALPYVIAIHEITGSWGVSMKPSWRAVGLTTDDAARTPPPESPLGAPAVESTARRDLRRAQRALERQAEAGGGREPTATRAETSARGLDVDEESDALAETDGATSLPEALGKSARELLATLRLELVLLTVPGVLLLRGRRDGSLATLLVLLGLYVALIAIHLLRNGYISSRHMMIPVMLLLPFSGAGWLVLWRARPRGVRIVLRAMLVLSVVTMLLTAIRPRRDDNGNRLEALAWVVEHTAPGERFGTHRRRDGWYAGRSVLTVALPCDEDELRRQAEHHDVAYLVLDLEDVEETMPELLAPDGGLTVVARFEDEAQGQPVVVCATPR